jgi:outer membrane lipoprotein carrier protein
VVLRAIATTRRSQRAARRTSRRLASLSSLLLCLVIVAASPRRGDAQNANPTAQDLAQSLQRKYDGIRDFSADFTHTYRGGVLRKAATERGHLLVKKPGKMRWEYTAPEQKLFVSDGVKMYSYIPQDKQVMVQSIPQGDEVSIPTMFLSGKGNLTRDFTPSIVEPPAGSPAGTLALKLVPLKAQSDYDWLVLAVAPGSLELRGLVTADAQGGQSTFSFTSLKENPGIADKQFAFSIPRGVDVVTDSPSR